MRPATSLHHDAAARYNGDRFEQLCTADPTAQNRQATLVNAMQLEDVFGKINAQQSDIHDDLRSLEDQVFLNAATRSVEPCFTTGGWDEAIPLYPAWLQPDRLRAPMKSADSRLISRKSSEL